MHSILNVGMNDAVVSLIAQPSGRYLRFALDTYRIFLQQFGVIVLNADESEYERVLRHARERDHVNDNHQLSVDSLLYVVNEFKLIAQVPDDVTTQLTMCLEALYFAWNAERYRIECHVLLMTPICLD
jgi:pyruvate, orthophosphate dikinase